MPICCKNGQKLYQRTGLNRNTNSCFQPQKRIQRSKSWHRNDDDDDDNDDDNEDDDNEEENDDGDDDDEDLTIPKRKLLPT